MTESKTYIFESIGKCEICESDTSQHIIMGQRLSTSQGFRPRRKSGISVTVKKCKNCGLVFSSPLPIPSSFQQHYGIPPESYWKPDSFEWNSNYFSSQLEDFSRIRGIERNMKALDIGAGLGKAMFSLERAGFDTFGVEPSITFREKAINLMHIHPNKLILGTMEEVSFENNCFDFITFGAVFEHLYHPLSSIEKAIEWLKPGGIIHIEVPSSKHLISRIINVYYRLKGTNCVTNLSPMHSPYHLYEFSLKSFKILEKKFQLELVYYRFDVGSIDFFPKFLYPFLRFWMRKTNSGMQLTVYLRKKKN